MWYSLSKDDVVYACVAHLCCFPCPDIPDEACQESRAGLHQQNMEDDMAQLGLSGSLGKEFQPKSGFHSPSIPSIPPT